MITTVLHSRFQSQQNIQRQNNTATRSQATAKNVNFKGVGSDIIGPFTIVALSIAAFWGSTQGYKKGAQEERSKINSTLQRHPNKVTAHNLDSLIKADHRTDSLVADSLQKIADSAQAKASKVRYHQ